MIFRYDDIPSYLKAVLARRGERDPGYSLRAFARDLALSPAYLSQLMSRKKKLSPRRRLDVADRLGLDGAESRYFYLLAQQEETPSEEVRQSIRRLLDDLAFDGGERLRDADAFRAVSDWQHLALLEMTYLDDFVLTPAAAAGRLGIAEGVAEAAIERLVRVGALVRDGDGRLAKADVCARYRAYEKNRDFAAYLRQVLGLAAEAVETQPLAERVFMASTFCLEESQLEEARNLTRDYMNRISALHDKAGRRTQCYQLSVQLFNLTDGRPKRPGASSALEG